MTRFKLIPWLAIPALLLLGPVMPTATAATSEMSLEDGLIYLPLEGAQATDAAASSRLTTSLTPGEVTVAQHGVADALVANRGRFLTVRFDLPFDAPYTLASLTFPSWVQIPNPALPFASFRSVRVLGMDPRTGGPDKPAAIATTANGTTIVTRASGSFIDDGVNVGDRVAGESVLANTLVTSVSATSLTTDQAVPIFSVGIVCELDTSAASPFNTMVLKRGAGSFVTDGVKVGDNVTGPGFLSPASVTAVSALLVATNAPVVEVFSEPQSRTFTRGQPQVREFIPPLNFVVRRYRGSNSGGMNSIPLNIQAGGPKTFFAVFDFPTPVAGVADTFPFLSTDRNFTEQGLFANSFATDTSLAAAVPASVGTLTGGTLLVDQNLQAALTCVLTGDAPLKPPAALGLQMLVGQFDFFFESPEDQRADGTPGHLTGTQLVRRDGGTWTHIANGGNGGGSQKISVASLPGSGLQIWGVRSVANQGGEKSWVSNVTITGSATVVAMAGSLGEDADEANGKSKEGEATVLTGPVSDRAESIWPGGDADNFQIYARPGDIVTATAVPTGIDFRNDLWPSVRLFDNNNDELAVQFAPNAGEAASLTVTIPQKGGSTALKPHYVRVADLLTRVTIPPTYNLSIDVQTPAALQQFAPDAAPVSGLLVPDQFAFANTGANPVRGHASFGYVIPRSSDGASVKLRIYDVRGRLVTTLDSGSKTAGTHFAAWSGHDSRGNRVASGPYFARLEAGSYSRTVRIDLLK